MYHVQTSHQIVGFGTEHMKLFDATTGEPIVTATRTDGTWTIAVDSSSIPDVTTTDRPAAITAMTEQALAALPGTGYSTLVPRELSDLP